MSVLMAPGVAAGGAAYQIDNSVRFNSADGARIGRTLSGSSTSDKICTWSLWYKRSGSNHRLAYNGNSGGSSNLLLLQGSGDALQVVFDGAATYSLKTNAVYRGYSAWYHVVLAVDTTQATAADRAKLYVNGTQVTSFSTSNYPPLNHAFNMGNTHVQYIGGLAAGQYDGYMAEVHFIDGQALTPSDFGETDATTGIWIPKRVTGLTYGTNGVYLDFANGASAAELGYDAAGSNDWTVNNISVTAGVGNDWLTDTPTNNYCTLNPLLPAGSYGASIANGALDSSTTGIAGTSTNFGNIPMTTGKWVAEFTVTTAGYVDATRIGIANVTGANTRDTNEPGRSSTSYGYDGFNGQKWNNNSGAAYGSAYTVNDRIRAEFDADNGTLAFWKNGVSQGTAFTGIPAGSYVWGVGEYAGSSPTYVVACNFGQRAFVDTPTTGFQALCTANLPAVSIVDPEEHYYAVEVIKSGDTNFTLPWDADTYDTLVDIKIISTTGDWYRIDGLRGYDKVLKINGTAAETTDANVVDFVGTTGTLKSTLADGTYLVQAWKAGLTASRQTNTDGTITSTVSRNTTSGFSICTYTGTGANATFGHGIGLVPKMQTIKRRDNTGSYTTWHANLSGNTYYINLNSDGAESNSGGATVWNSTSPTSSLVSVGTDSTVNANTGTFVAWVWAEVAGFSKFGGYTGNASSDGPYLDEGFAAATINTKKRGGINSWYQYDYVRESGNFWRWSLSQDINSGEVDRSSITPMDSCAGGHKLRNSADGWNASAAYIYYAFAKTPFGGSNVPPGTAR